MPCLSALSLMQTRRLSGPDNLKRVTPITGGLTTSMAFGF